MDHDVVRWAQVMNCFQAKAGQLATQWYVIDATDRSSAGWPRRSRRS